MDCDNMVIEKPLLLETLLKNTYHKKKKKFTYHTQKKKPPTLKGFLFSCIAIIWLFRTLLLANCFPHMEHWKGLDTSCLAAMCVLSVEGAAEA